MELTISSQLDPTPWVTPTPSPQQPSSPSTLLRGRSYFSHLGHLRTKPGRPDSPPTHSKSCSDKLTTKQLTSLLLTPTSYIIAPSPNAYISTLILPASEYDPTGCDRAFSSRLANVEGFEGEGGYAWRPFTVLPSSAENITGFTFSRRNVTGSAPESVIPSNISAAMVLQSEDPGAGMGMGIYTTETLIGGVLQGRKAFSAGTLGASRLSKHRLWGSARDVAGGWLESTRGLPGTKDSKELLEWMVGQTGPYETLKVPSSTDPLGAVENTKSARWAAKRRVRDVLANAGGRDGDAEGEDGGRRVEWVRNGGNDFGL